MKFNWPQFKRSAPAKTVGRVLKIKLPELGIKGLQAKVDTGAYSGALHATKIREIISEDGQKMLSFKPRGRSKKITVTDYHKRVIRSSNGVAAKRYAIDTEIEILGRSYPITVTLTNRSAMKYEMLIGRNFLQRHGFIVDVNSNSR